LKSISENFSESEGVNNQIDILFLD
jgi:hypothetical protein